MKILPAIISLSAILGLSGCAIATYTEYAGQQQKWPTAQGAFVAKKDGILIFRGLPDRPYTLMGEVVIDQYPQYMDGAIAHAAHVHKADGAMIVSKQVVNGGLFTTGGGGTTYYQGQGVTSASGSAYPSGNGIAANALINSSSTATATTIANPTYTGSISWDRTSVYLIKFINQ
jgi:hypothetical protein